MNNIKRNNIVFFFISLTVILGILIFFNINDKDMQDISNERESNTIGMLVSDLYVEQTFISEHNGLTSIEVMLATYNRINNSNVTLQVIDHNGQNIYTQMVPASELQDNAYYRLDFNTIKDSKNKEYKIVLFSDALDANNAITAWASSFDNYTSGKLYINGQDVGFDLAFRSFYSSKINSGLLVLFMILMLISCSAFVLIFKAFVLNKSKNKLVQFVFWISSSICLAFSLTTLYNYMFLAKIEMHSIFGRSGLLRTVIFFLPSLLFTSFLYFSKTQITKFLLNKRWIIAGVMFILCVSLNLNLSNVSVWNEYIQPSIEMEMGEPVIGVGRSIRGDEWLVDLTRKATGELVGYGPENYIFRGTYNSGLSGSGLYLSYSALNNPLNWGYYILGFEYGVSFYWSGIFILGFMIPFELCFIISNKKSLLALFGATLIGLSQFLLWWSMPVIWLAIQSTIVCIYYFVNSNKKTHKILLALGVVFSSACFITNLYPAWQVPLAYLLVTMLVWIVIKNREKIKEFKLFEWMTIASAFVFVISIILSYLYDNKFYVENVMTTVYPGHRLSTGGWIINKAFSYPETLLFPFKETNNPCEASTMFDLFPIPIFISIINFVYQVVQKVKKKCVKIDILNFILLLCSLFVLIYCTIGIPEVLAKVSLFCYSTPQRAVDVLGLLCVLLMIRNLGAETNEKFKMPIYISAAISSLVVVCAVYYSNANLNNYMPVTYIAFIAIFLFVLSMALFDAFPTKIKNKIVTITIAILAVTGLAVEPITSGVNALKAKPISVEIQKIAHNEPQAIWASTYWFASNYIAANGGRCITSTNYIPNIELWSKLDPEGLYSDIYNRYAHINFQIVDEQTNFELLGEDSISLNLSKSDLYKCEIDYIYSIYPLSSEDGIVEFKLIYAEAGSYIYKLEYL